MYLLGQAIRPSVRNVAIPSALMLLVGCSRDEQPRVVNPQHEVSPGTTVRAVTVNVSADQVSIEPAKLGLIPKLADFPSDVNFFSQPKASLDRIDVAANSGGAAESVRLLGFINPNPLDESQKLALLKVGDSLVQLRVGESIDGIELLSIDDRNATLQRDRDRWTLAMMDQPVVNHAASPMKRRHAPASAGTATARNAVPRSDLPRFVAPLMPALPGLPVDHASSSSFELRKDLPMPAMPELPDLGRLPGF